MTKRRHKMVDERDEGGAWGEETPEEMPAEQPVPLAVPVRVVRAFAPQVRGAKPATLVEWVLVGPPLDYARGVVPTEALFSNAAQQTFCPQAVLEQAVPWGLPWEGYIALAVSAEAIARTLRQRGFWTIEDVQANPTAAAKAFTSFAQQDFISMLKAAERGEGR
jgi:hypothetical protein